MDNHTLHNNLQRLMKLHGHMSVSDLAKETNIPQPTLHHISSGQTKRPRRDTLHILANYFGINIDQLLGYQPLQEKLPLSLQQELNLCYIPIITTHQARTWPNYAVREEEQTQQLVLSDVNQFDGFAMVYTEHHPEAIFPKGCLLIFDCARKASSQDYILIKLATNESLQLRQLIMSDGKSYLVEHVNDEPSLIAIEPYQDRIIATLIESRIRFHENGE